MPEHIQILHSALKSRKEKNARYSMRAFASFLGLHPSALSRILSGKQDLSVPTAMQIIRKLKLEAAEQERFIVSVGQEKTRVTLATLNKASENGHAETSLRETEERFRPFFELVEMTASLNELIRDEQGRAIDARVLRVNQAWVDTVGFRPEEIIGRPISEWLPLSADGLVKMWDRIILSQRSERLEEYIPDLDQWYEVVILPTEGDRTISLGNNVTERRKREERLKDHEHLLFSIFNTIPLGIGVVDREGRTILQNGKMAEYLPTHDRWMGYGADGSVIPHEEYPGAKALRGEATIPGLKMSYRQDNGTITWMRVAAVPLRGKDGEVKGAVSIVSIPEEEK